MPPFHQILLAQACAILATIAAGATGGLIAASRTRAIAPAAAIYAASQATVLAWAAWRTTTRHRRLELSD